MVLARPKVMSAIMRSCAPQSKLNASEGTRRDFELSVKGDGDGKKRETLRLPTNDQNVPTRWFYQRLQTKASAKRRKEGANNKRASNTPQRRGRLRRIPVAPFSLSSTKRGSVGKRDWSVACVFAMALARHLPLNHIRVDIASSSSRKTQTPPAEFHYLELPLAVGRQRATLLRSGSQCLTPPYVVGLGFGLALDWPSSHRRAPPPSWLSV